MIAALDSNVLLDILIPNVSFFDRSLAAITKAASRGSLVICNIVYTELACHFPRQAECDRFLEENGIRVEPIDRAACYAASRAWREHWKAGGRRDRVLADFLIGAHAMAQANCLVTRDRGFYRGYFPELVVVDPASEVME